MMMMEDQDLLKSALMGDILYVFVLFIHLETILQLWMQLDV